MLSIIAGLLSHSPYVACGGDRCTGWWWKTMEVVNYHHTEFDTETPVTIHFWHRMGAQMKKWCPKWVTEFKEMYQILLLY